MRKPLNYISAWTIRLIREASTADGYSAGEKQVALQNLRKIKTELEVAKLMLKEILQNIS